MIKRIKLSFLFIAMLCGAGVNAQFRVIGYVHFQGSVPDVTRLGLDKLTHLNLAFINPDSAGNFLLPEGMDSVISAAHRYPVKVLASLGGGSVNPYTAKLLMDGKRAQFVANLVQMFIDHNLDGIDVDLEGEAIDANYDKLIAELSAALKPAGKLLTAAFATWNANTISNGTLKKFDFINIMSYDQTGPWRPKEPGPHSTYIKAEEDMNYWTATRGFSKKKINLGLPFYGYCFGTKYGESMTFGEITAKFPGSEEQDMVVPDGGGIIYYNGIPTISSKTALALKKAGGVMIWELQQDGVGKFSLLQKIKEVIDTSVK